MKLKKNEKRKSESGAIMLEVVAVLSLMGLMGTVLYRQIYQRNQELHNIQMASEIRIVKEAFSAWIHANTAPLYTMCDMSHTSPTNVSPCSDAVSLDEIKDYLPDGYFFEGGESNYLSDNYSFHLFGYWRGTGSAVIPTYYGVVVPRPEAMLPDGGGNEDTWNFRRAARVAMLVGIDGGAYDPNITGPDIVGSVGTWSLDANGILDSSIPTYVAMTGLDVFQPEVELPPIDLGLPEDWSKAFQGLNAYGLFTVGQDTGCFDKHGTALPTENNNLFELQSDNIKTPNESCKPAFWVTTGTDNNTGEESGHVYVLNDLHVGADPAGTSGIQLKKEGAIVFNDTVADPQDKQEKNYLLDPAYTSVMNDVKLMSRGGAKLSDILPNYILKDVKRGQGSVKVVVPSNYCPKGYVVGIRANPISWSDDNELSTTDTGTISDGSTTEKNGHTHSLNNKSVTLPTTLAKAKERVVLFSNGEECEPENAVDDEYVDKNFGARLHYITMRTTKTACVGWRDKGSTEKKDFKIDGGAVLEVSVYCIWPDGIDIDGDGEPESVWPYSIDIDGDGEPESVEKPPSEREGSSDETYCSSFKAKGTCTLMGCKWNNGNCTKK